ncbi:hypothetical protein FALB51S_03357 [Frigidibacter albus]|uniref:Uncharacterized protein n=1 Tax=Frigidibacter mobilis TaxID=1335048 RepID=A0A159Z3I5_9RHOB|nr:hypothetical protein AKL17_2427 [Frigidibacter mobilis]
MQPPERSEHPQPAGPHPDAAPPPAAGVEGPAAPAPTLGDNAPDPAGQPLQGSRRPVPLPLASRGSGLRASSSALGILVGILVVLSIIALL